MNSNLHDHRDYIPGYQRNKEEVISKSFLVILEKSLSGPKKLEERNCHSLLQKGGGGESMKIQTNQLDICTGQDIQTDYQVVYL